MTNINKKRDIAEDFSERLIDKILITMNSCSIGALIVGWAIFCGLICRLALWLKKSDQDFG